MTNNGGVRDAALKRRTTQQHVRVGRDLPSLTGLSNQFLIATHT